MRTNQIHQSMILMQASKDGDKLPDGSGARQAPAFAGSGLTVAPPLRQTVLAADPPLALRITTMGKHRANTRYLNHPKRRNNHGTVYSSYR